MLMVGVPTELNTNETRPAFTVMCGWWRVRWKVEEDREDSNQDCGGVRSGVDKIWKKLLSSSFISESSLYQSTQEKKTCGLEE
eukprot:13887345-Ditylum_brightwellii.AAC.1